MKADLGTVIAETVMLSAARLLGEKLRGADLDRFTQLLREETKAGLPELLDLMKETVDTFVGSESMLRSVLAAECMGIAAKAWVRYQKEMEHDERGSGPDAYPPIIIRGGRAVDVG